MSKLSTFFNAVATHGKSFAKTAMTVAKGHSPAIFAGTAIIGAVAIAYTTYKCTPKYKQAVEEAEQTVKTDEYGSTTVERGPMPKKEKAKIFVKTMWPMLVAIIVTCSSVVMSHKMSAKKIAILSAAYTTATQKASEAAEKKAEAFIKEKLGDDAAKEYKDKVEKEREENKTVLRNSINSNGIIYDTGAGDCLFVDYMTGVMFRSSTGYIQAILDTFNTRACVDSEDFITYGDILSSIIPDWDGMVIADKVGYFAEDLALNGYKLEATFGESQSSIFDEAGRNKLMANGEWATLFRINQDPASNPEA